MLKIGIVKWRGKCSKHAGYDPHVDGRGGIRGGCERCQMLCEIQEYHQKMLALMRTFAPPEQKRQTKRQDDSHLQESLFDEL